MMRPTSMILVLAALIFAACGTEPSRSASTPAALPAPDTSVTSPAQVIAPSAGATRSVPSPDAPVSELVTGFNNAGLVLLHDQNSEENLVLSPTSISHALLMARGAADDPTETAIDQLLSLPRGISADQAWNAVDFQLTTAAERTEEITLQLADRIWPRLDIDPDQVWIDLLASEHGSDVQPLDMAADPEGSRQIINAWVAEQTNDLIPDLLPENFVTPDTVLVLTDAIYFEAEWETPFGKYGPERGTFTRLDGSNVELEFMRELELSAPRAQLEGWSAAELPYRGGEFSMLVIIPDAGRFGEVRSQLSPSFLADLDSQLTEGPYELLIPKWTTTTSIDLMPWLLGAGIAPGNYPGISEAAFLGGAVHGADIAVDELGTVAAAATGLGFQESGPPEPEFTIAADKPFLYVIRHVDTGLILFAGQVTDPSQ